MRPTLPNPSPPRASRRDQLERAVLQARSTGIASVSCSGWTSGEIVGTLIRCGSQLQREGQQIRLVVIGTGVAAKLGFPDRTPRPVLVGGLRTMVSHEVASDLVEVAFGSADHAGLN